MNRSWCAVCQYDGKDQFFFGTVVVSRNATMHEIEAETAALWATISPHPMPRIVNLIPGELFFAPEDAA